MIADEPGPLSCPRCASGPLRPADGALACASCSFVFPFVGAIPCLMNDPALWRALWASRLDEYLALVKKRVFFSRQESELPDRLPRTRQRIVQLMAGLEHQQTQIAAILRPLSSGAFALPARPEARPSLALLDCYENIFRDWAWGVAEIDRVRALVEPAMPAAPGTLAIYGAGAGRLAADVHRHAGSKRTYALDVNPLPLLVADALLRGATVALPEMPVAPHACEQAVINHRLHFDRGAGDGFQLLFADALRPPFAPGVVDVVLTPWFIDAVDADLRVTAAAINRVLRRGGIWVNVGPLRFRGELSRQYSGSKRPSTTSSPRRSSSCDRRRATICLTLIRHTAVRVPSRQCSFSTPKRPATRRPRPSRAPWRHGSPIRAYRSRCRPCS